MTYFQLISNYKQKSSPEHEESVLLWVRPTHLQLARL